MLQAAQLRRRSSVDSQLTLVLLCLFGAGCSNSTTARESGVAATTAPQISAQPFNQFARIGESTAFSVSATGTSPLSYDWRRNGVSLNAPSNRSYVTPLLAKTDDGAGYTVVVSNAAGSAVSAPARLAVSSGPSEGDPTRKKPPMHR